MKKYWKIGLSILPVVVGAAACFAACKDTPEHTHSFNTAWSSDATYHWHAASCEHKDEVSDKAAHTFESNANETKHWLECTVCEYKKDEASHELVNGVCACGYVDPSIRLVYKLTNNAYTVSINPVALGDKSFTNVVIPAEYEGKAVTAIAENGFNGAKYIKEISLPSSVTVINDYAFEDCESLTKIELPEGLTTLGNQVFVGCKSLAGTVKMPAAITVIGENLFLNCEKLGGIEFSANTTRIGTQAFANCKALTSVTIPNNVSFIGMKAFKGTGLTEVTVPESATEIHSYVFQDCTSLVTATINATNTNFTGAIFNGCTKLKNLTIPFVGQDEHPLDKQIPSFGFIFGTYAYGSAGETYTAVQGGKTYYIPASLTALTVGGGQLKAGMLDNITSLQTVMLKEKVEILATEFEGCTATFDWEVAPTLTDVKLTKDNADVTTADLNEKLALSYEVGLLTKVSVAVKKGGEVATEGYSYDAEKKELTFTAYGEYSVEVTATRGGMDTTKSVSIAVENATATKAVVALAWADDVTGTAEGDTVSFSAECTYPTGATKGTEDYSVYVLSGTNYENADANVYELNETDKTFTPKFGGTYRIFLTATTQEGAVTREHIDLTVALSELEFTDVTSSYTATNGWLRFVTDTEKTFTTTLTSGYLDGYNLTYTGAEGATVTASKSGNTITYTVSSTEANTAEIKAVYTHKNDSTKKYEVAFPAISFVTSEDAPVLAADPFDGTHSELIPSTGLMLYYDVTSNGSQIAAENVTFELVDGSELKNGGIVKIGKLINGEQYVVVNDSDNNANGKITLKMIATVDGKTAVASKTFIVKTVANNTAITNYIKEVLDTNYAPTNMSFIGNDAVRNNMVVSKTGIVHYRDGGSDLEKELLRFDINANNTGAAIKQYQIDFKFTVLQNNNNMNLTVGFRQGNWDGWVGQLAYRPNYVQNSGGNWEKTDKLEVQGWSLGDGSHETDGSKLKSAAAGTVVYGRVTRTISGSNVSYTAYWADSADGEYVQVCRYTSSSGNTTNDTYAMQIGVAGGDGFYIENLQFTNLGA